MQPSSHLGLILGGTALVLMPQIYAAVLAANVTYAQGLAAATGQSASIEAPASPVWLSAASVALGAGMIALGAWRSIRGASNPPSASEHTSDRH